MEMIIRFSFPVNNVDGGLFLVARFSFRPYMWCSGWLLLALGFRIQEGSL